MSRTVTLNVTDTAGGVAPTLTGVAKNYGADFGPIENPPAGCFDISNKNSPVDAPNTERYALRQIKDAYKNTSVAEAYKPANKSGWSLLSQCNLIATITDSEDATYRVDAPLAMRVTISGVNVPELTTTHYTTGLMRAIGGLYETTGDLRLGSMIRNILKPTGM
jgi:hypothetical protein